MSQCAEIKVFGLSQEASARLGGATAAALDLPADVSLRLSKDVERLSVAGKISTEGALGFDLDFTPTNNAIFSAFASPLTLDNNIQFYRVGVTVEGHGLQFDRLVVTGRGSAWACELRRSPDHWVELASQHTTNEIDFGTFDMTAASFLANWQVPVYAGATNATYWPLIDYGGWCDETAPLQGTEDGRYVKAVGYEDFRPLLALTEILKRGFCLFGWTIESVLFDTEYFKRLWIYDLRKDYYVASKTGGRVIGRDFDVLVPPDVSYVSFERFLYFKETVAGLAENLLSHTLTGASGSTGTVKVCGIKNFSGVALKYTFRFKGSIKNGVNVPVDASFLVQEVVPDGGTRWKVSGEILSADSLDLSFSANEEKSVTYEDTITLKPGQSAAVCLMPGPVFGGVIPNTFLVLRGLYFECVPASKCLMLKDTVTVSDCVSADRTILDWTKTFVHLCDGRMVTDMDTKTVIVFPNRRASVYGEVAPQFLKTEEAAVDISRLIVEGSIKSKPVRPELKRRTRLEFADAGDAYIDSLNLSSPAHSRTISNGDDLPNEVESIQNPVLEPTLEGQTTGLATDVIYVGKELIYRKSPYLPRLWDNDSGERSFAIGPRILFAFGYVSQLNPDPGPLSPDYSNFFLNTPPNDANTGMVEQFGYATQLRTWDIVPAPDMDGNVVFGTVQNDLFVNFYLGLTQEQRRGTEIDLLMRMQMKDYVGYDFRSLYAFRYNGIPLRVPMTGIRDFQACSQLPTPVTFFVEPSDTECCDLPCGCQFTTCEYYQDFGEYMRQATLDALLITSFEVDGIELLSAPVGFGDVQISDVGGKPFVMNLVNALNSIGAPYFSFGVSTRIHPTRGARFFTIKHLACVPFRILIKLSGAECYLYTQAEQKQKYFSGTWSALGYAPETFTAPTNCQTVTEY